MTGVQTCALPISAILSPAPCPAPQPNGKYQTNPISTPAKRKQNTSVSHSEPDFALGLRVPAPHFPIPPPPHRQVFLRLAFFRHLSFAGDTFAPGANTTRRTSLHFA